jgi:hypothetical protein
MSFSSLLENCSERFIVITVQETAQSARDHNARLNERARMLEQQLDHDGVHIRYTQQEVCLMSSLPASLSENPHETQSPKEKSGLEWGTPVWTSEARTHGYVISLCERYMLDRSNNTYTAYRRATSRAHRGIYLGYTNDAAAAKSLCQQDLEISEQANGGGRDQIR